MRSGAHLRRSAPWGPQRDEPGSGGVRVGQTRSDLDCRVVATSRRVAPTECDSRLPLFGRGSTCRLRLLDSWPPPGSGVVFDSSRGSTRVSRSVAPTESDSSDKRRTWAVAQLVRLVRLVGRRCHNAARLVRLADGRVAARLVRLLGLCRTKMSRRGATRPTSRRSSRRSTRRLVRLLGLCTDAFTIYSSEKHRGDAVSRPARRPRPRAF